MSERFPLYTTDYISGVMSLRKPQTASLRILEEIVTSVNLRKGMNLKAALGSVHAMYPTCSDFEREFMSLTFTLATGVGKTRLMGAFIAYLYTQHNIKNFFVVAPNTTIYVKRKKDLNNNNSPKYVFCGLGCFPVLLQIITDDDYRDKSISLYDSDIHIFIYNIDKFNKESANTRMVTPEGIVRCSPGWIRRPESRRCDRRAQNCLQFPLPGQCCAQASCAWRAPAHRGPG